MLSALSSLDVSIDEAAQVPTLTLAPRQLHHYLVGLQSIRSRLDALLCSVTADADRAAVQTTTGHRSTASSIGASTNADPGLISADRVLGRWLDEFPLFADAFAAGILTRRHVHALKKIDIPRTHLDLIEAQQYLIDAAAGCTWRDFAHVLRYWLLGADPDGDEPAEHKRGRRGSIRTLADGMVKQVNYFDPLTGAAVKNAVDTRAKAFWRADLDAAARATDDEFTARTHAQRMADASAELQIGGHHATAPPGSPPLIHIVMSEEVAEDALTRLADPDGVAAGRYPSIDPDRLPLDAHDVDGRCELIDGTPIHPAEAVAFLSRATLRRLILGPDCEVLDLGRAVRGFPRRLHQALLASGRGRCAFDGCDSPVSWLEADHVFPWAKGGRTSLRNGQLLCGPHNRAKGATINPDPPIPPQRE